MDKSENSSMDKDGNAEAAASKRPRQNENEHSTEPAAPASPVAKRNTCNSGNILKDLEGTAMPETDGQAVLEAESRESHYHKVRTLPLFMLYYRTVKYLSWHLKARCCM